MLNWLAKNHLAKKNLSAKLGLTANPSYTAGFDQGCGRGPGLWC